MTEDRRTKAQLIEELGKAQDRISELSTAARAASVDTRSPEAKALDQCMKALDAIYKERSASFSGRSDQSVRNIDWVLRTLAGKYDIEITRQVPIPCDRQHIDGMSAAELGVAISQMGRAW